MALFFASNAIYPIAKMPGWLQVISRINPLSYKVDALKAMMLADGSSFFGPGLDFAGMGLSTIVLILVKAYLYPIVVI